MKKWIMAGILSFVLSASANAALVGYWNFNEEEGAVVHNRLDANEGLVHGADWCDGKYGPGLCFQSAERDGVSMEGAYSSPNSMTWMAWVYFRNSDEQNQIARGGDSFTLFTATESLGPDQKDKLALRIPGLTGGEGAGDLFFSHSRVSVNQWYHIAFTYDGSSVKIYLNGQRDSETPAQGLFSGIGGPMEIGANADGGMDGKVDEVRAYTHVLTPAEIGIAMNDKGQVGEPPLAVAGDDVEASANRDVLLNGSQSNDDGTIVRYRWIRLPDYAFLCASAEPTCPMKTLGRAEEAIALDVVDNDGNIARDLVSIFHKMPGACGNGTIEDDEICDGNTSPCLNAQGYSGTQYCDQQCSAFGDCIVSEYCGDGQVNGNEACDKNSQGCTVDGYAGTQVCNDQCLGFGECLSGLSCGDGIKNGPEVCDGNTQACATSAGYAGTQSCNGQCTGFGTCTSNLSCGDHICSVPPETASNCSQDCGVSFSVTLEAENMATKTTGQTTSGGWNIYADGYIEDTVQFPAAGTYKVDIIAKGKAAAQVWPNMQLRIDQNTQASFVVNSTRWATYTANINVTQGSHKVAIAFTNDYYSPPEDRNLYVDKVTIKK